MRSCDGVIWEGDNVIGKAKEALQYLREEGKRIFFVTNNATKSRMANKEKFDKLGIECKEVSRQMRTGDACQVESLTRPGYSAGRGFYFGVCFGLVFEERAKVPGEQEGLRARREGS